MDHEWWTNYESVNIVILDHPFLLPIFLCKVLFKLDIDEDKSSFRHMSYLICVGLCVCVCVNTMYVHLCVRMIYSNA